MMGTGGLDSGAADSACLMRLEAAGDSGSSLAFRLPSATKESQLSFCIT